MEMVSYDPSSADPAKTKVIGKVVRYTNILEAPIPELLNEDGKLIVVGQIIIAQKLVTGTQERHLRDDGWCRGDIVSLPRTGTSLFLAPSW